ncbi:ImuA family protein [Asaia krungthepensis]|uniref:ImuA family protein n=1 Tax=Asaia krungthepensis TaxID=220990 RepID=UPI0022321041|nr:hypothetical protein [Asaia krungthepensis]
MADMAMLRDSIMQIERRYQHDFAALYLQTGMIAVDDALKGGLRRGAVHEFMGEGHDRVLCARPTRLIAQILARTTGPVIWIMPVEDKEAPHSESIAGFHKPAGRMAAHENAPHGLASVESSRDRVGSAALTLAGISAAGLDPQRLLCVEVDPSRLVGTMEDILRTRNVTAVVADLTEPLSLTASRRLHLAAEKTSVTGFVVHRHRHPLLPNSCWTRWQVGAACSAPCRVGGRDVLSFSGGMSLSLLRRRGGDPLFWRVDTDHDASTAFPVAAALAHDTLAQGASRSRCGTPAGLIWS